MVRQISKTILASALSAAVISLSGQSAYAHPHVFVDAKLELIQNEQGQFAELKHSWTFDPIFSSTVYLDFDTDADGKLNDAELLEVGKTIKTNISEFDFFTSLRKGKEVAYFEAPDKLVASLTGDNQVKLELLVKLDKPVDASGKEPFRVSVSDSSFYVAFDFKDDSAIKITGSKTNCKQDIAIPDFDKLLDENNLFAESFFDDPNEAKTAEYGDEFYTWIDIKCGLPS